MTPRRDDAANLTGAAALNALDAADEKLLAARLEASEDTRAELTELRDTAVLLGLAVDPIAPPAALKASIFAQLDSTPQLPALDANAPETNAPEVIEPVPSPLEAAPAVTVPVATDAAVAGPVAVKANARWFARPSSYLALAAAIAVVSAGTVATVNFVSVSTQAQAEANRLAALNGAPDSQRLSAPIATGGSATLVWSARSGESALIVDGLAPLPADKVYALWLIDDNGPRPAGTFTVDENESAWRMLDGDIKPGDVVGVTIEPLGGSDAPTTDPIVAIASA